MTTVGSTPMSTPSGVKKASQSEYVVLRAADSLAGTWIEVKTVTAVSGDAAIKEAVGTDKGTYVAVPARSWNPRKVTVTTEQRVVLS